MIELGKLLQETTTNEHVTNYLLCIDHKKYITKYDLSAYGCASALYSAAVLTSILHQS